MLGQKFHARCANMARSCYQRRTVRAEAYSKKLKKYCRYMNAWRSDCICPDGFAPRCRANGRLLTCPDGSDFDPNLGEPYQGYTHRCDTAPMSAKKVGDK